MPSSYFVPQGLSVRIVLSFFVIVFCCFISHVQADIAFSYSGFGGDILWSSNTAVSPISKIGGPAQDVPVNLPNYALSLNSDDYFSLHNPPSGVLPSGTMFWDARLLNSNNGIKIFQDTTSQIDTFNPAQLLNKQLDVGHYNYYAFTVSQTQTYHLSFQFEGNFDGVAVVTGNPAQQIGYVYSGTDALIEFYDAAQGQQNAIARYTFSEGENGTMANHVISPSEYQHPISMSWSKDLILEAGKVYQMNMGSYAYSGGAGFMSVRTKMTSTFSISAVPEPTSLILLGTTLSAAATGAYRKRRLGAV